MADDKKDDQDKKKKLKQGKSDEITKKATDEEKDFKTSGIEGTKDSSPKPPPEGDSKSEIQNPKSETTDYTDCTDKKGKSEIQSPIQAGTKSEIVRGEDVVKILRAKGVKI